jgi:DNA-binding response OmpR family regulator
VNLLSGRDPSTMGRDELIAYCYSLESRLEAFSAHVAGQQIDKLRDRFGISPSEAKILAAMGDGRVHSKDHFSAILYSGQADDAPETNVTEVLLTRLRKKLVGTGITIANRRGRGWFVPEQDVLKAAIEGTQ